VILLLTRKPGSGWISLDLGLEIAAWSLCIGGLVRKSALGAGHLDGQTACVIKNITLSGEHK
jgi:hypothetical protein